MGSVNDSNSDLPFPLIDFASFDSSHSTDSPHGKPNDLQEHIAKDVLSAFTQHGFLYLTNHGISPDMLSSVFQCSQTFFSRPEKEKEMLAWTTPGANRGWSAPGREKLALLDSAPSQAGPGDLKESFEIGREGVDGYPNQWPDSVIGKTKSDLLFKDKMLEFYQRCRGLFARVMRAVALGLDLREDWFDSFLQKGDCTLRLLYYPGDDTGQKMNKSGSSSREAEEEAKMRAAAHTDYGAITLLFQDAHPGLQVLSPSGTFIDAPPVPGAVIVNAGDLLARWSNDTIKSTIHRVVSSPFSVKDNGSDVQYQQTSRYSIAFFCNPDFDRWIEAIPGSYDDERSANGQTKKYDGIYSGEYLEQRLSATY